MQNIRFLSCTVLFALAAPLRAEKPPTGPWNLAELRRTPKVTWIDEDGPLRKFTYESVPSHGKPTRVFAYYAQPAKVEGKLPAMVLLHGGGGKAFPEWAKLWADRGYIALAMDLVGVGHDGKKLPDGGPDQGDFTLWSYHAVAAAIHGVSLLRSLPQVDAERIGVTGISWGGYLTCIVAGLDDRLKVAVPVYGCGLWYDKYLAPAKMPMLFVNGTNDFAFALDSYQKSYRLVKNRQLCILVNLAHGHPEGWSVVEIGLFVDQYLKKGTPLPAFVGDLVQAGDPPKLTAQVGYKSAEPLAKAEVHWTTDLDMPWQKRNWQSKSAAINDGKISAIWSEKKPHVFFLTITDQRKATVSTEHVTLKTRTN